MLYRRALGRAWASSLRMATRGDWRRKFPVRSTVVSSYVQVWSTIIHLQNVLVVCPRPAIRNVRLSWIRSRAFGVRQREGEGASEREYLPPGKCGEYETARHGGCAGR